MYSCEQISNRTTGNTYINTNEEQTYYQEFTECGFSIKCPCKLEDISKETRTDFLINYAGITDKEDNKRIALYQLMVSKLPIGHKDIDAKTLEDALLDKIKSTLYDLNVKEIKPIFFSYNEYPGYVGECTTSNGRRQKAVMFVKQNYIICLTVISNNDLISRFNKFTNSITFLDSDNQNSSAAIKNVIKQKVNPIGLYIETPCQLIQSKLDGFDNYYYCETNSQNDNLNITYKIMINALPIKYSTMIESDKKAIKQNLLNHIKSFDSYHEKGDLKIPNHFAYTISSIGYGLNSKECLILTDKYVIELIVVGKPNINISFDNFINSLSE